MALPDYTTQDSSTYKANIDQSISDNLNRRNENGVTTIATPQGGAFNGGFSSMPGAIVITLPQTWTDTMLKFEIDVYNYQEGESFTVFVSGFTNSAATAWQRPSINIKGSILVNYKIRLGHDGSKLCVAIGETSSTWQYPVVAVKNFQAGNLNQAIANWESEWDVSLETSLAGYTFTVDEDDNLPAASEIVSQGDLATQDTVNYATQVTNKPTLISTAIDIGDWDMDTDGAITVAHGLTLSNIKGFNAFIRNDAGTSQYPINIENSGTVLGSISALSSDISLTRAGAGFFNSASYSATSYNRGYIIIWHTE